MTVHFYIRYKTPYGQSLAIHLKNAENNADNAQEIALQYLNDEYWYGIFEPSADQQEGHFYYQYHLLENNSIIKSELWSNRSLNLKKITSKSVFIYDDWQDIAFYSSVFATRAFTKVFEEHSAKGKESTTKSPTHIFEVNSSHLPQDHILCLIGSGKKLNDWDKENPVLFKRKNNCWTAKLNLSKESFPIEYKFAIYDTVNKQIRHIEDGSNRVLNQANEKGRVNILHQFVNFYGHTWKGAGVNVQLSALKSENSWGIGDFTDVNLLTDWSIATGIKMIQLLPINDTTVTYDRNDSYPYSAISAFALHPVFLNVKKMARAANLEFPEDLLEEVKKINDLPTMDYDSVVKIKYNAISELYEKEKYSFKDDFGYFDFFALNRTWLVPYAAFCYLRDKYKTADFSQWKDYAVYDEEKIQQLVSPDSGHYDKIAIHYYTQYHLHLQLRDAVDYAHKNGIIIKGDLPIGVGRLSVDTWVNPTLFHMDMQAGAPPDAFTSKGQNWSFPTYNWEAMQKNNYGWWRQRMEHMSNYFDAIRIDHVLGFFRIWSIPLHAIEGIFGVFVPAHPLHADDFRRAGIHFNDFRLCEPYINDAIINETFGEHTAWVREHIFDGNRFKEQFRTQRAIADYFKKHKYNTDVQQRLFDLLGNVILFRDDKKQDHYHFRISINDTSSYRYLNNNEKPIIDELYRRYFFENQNELWYNVALTKLDALKNSSDMLICAEDLGMVPEMVEGVLKSREMLALQVQRMPKKATEEFSHPANAPYLSVVTPSTHDMSTIRQWWEEDRKVTQSFYNHLLGHYGAAPYYCEPWIARDIILQHMQSPAMWSVFLLQDLMSIDPVTRREKPSDERINIPADPNHYWNYRMHLTLEFLLSQENFNNAIHGMVLATGR